MMLNPHVRGVIRNISMRRKPQTLTAHIFNLQLAPPRRACCPSSIPAAPPDISAAAKEKKSANWGVEGAGAASQQPSERASGSAALVDDDDIPVSAAPSCSVVPSSPLTFFCTASASQGFMRIDYVFSCLRTLFMNHLHHIHCSQRAE